MSKRTEETINKIHAYAREEFLEKGYKGASLRNIMKKAGMTTGALFGYYKDKQELFEGLVEGAAEGLKEYFLDAQEEFAKTSDPAKCEYCFEYSGEKLRGMIDYIYEHFDSFKLVINCAEGTKYADYLDEIIEIELKYDFIYLTFLQENGYEVKIPNKMLLHMLTKAYMTAIFETVAHDMGKEEAYLYIEEVEKFFLAGWSTLFPQNKTEL